MVRKNTYRTLLSLKFRRMLLLLLRTLERCTTRFQEGDESAFYSGVHDHRRHCRCVLCPCLLLIRLWIFLGSLTSILVNPLWVIQATQATRGMTDNGAFGPTNASRAKPMNILETVQHILRKDGASAFLRGIGPALVFSLGVLVLQWHVNVPPNRLWSPTL
jgi:hypothetical protein